LGLNVTMPDGFDPHVELERIYTLRELMTECRKRVPVILQELDDILMNPDVDKRTKLVAMDMALNRGFGKPRQHVYVSDDTGGSINNSRVRVYIPDNGRSNSSPIIDAEAA
jgi:hypothetical protein